MLPAVNLGAAQARGQALLVFNPDCLVQEGDLRRLLALLADKPKAGLIGAVVCDADGHPDPASLRRDPLLRRSLNSMLGRASEKVNMEQGIVWHALHRAGRGRSRDFPDVA